MTKAALWFGYAFLYAPIALLITFSFNASRMLTSWSGFTWNWYVVLFHDAPLIEAARLSLEIAAMAATGATILGLAAGYALARFGRFRLRPALTLGLAAPLIMPDVLIGLSLLLLFVTIGWPRRGVATIVLAHITFSLSYVAVIVRARLAGTDRALEDAAADLGATPFTAFRRVTLPLVAPALLSGWLMAFTLSLDDLVVASFVSGPGASTLPMVVFSALKLGATPELDALATIILAICGLGLAASAWLTVARGGARL